MKFNKLVVLILSLVSFSAVMADSSYLSHYKVISGTPKPSAKRSLLTSASLKSSYYATYITIINATNERLYWYVPNSRPIAGDYLYPNVLDGRYENAHLYNEYEYYGDTKLAVQNDQGELFSGNVCHYAMVTVFGSRMSGYSTNIDRSFC